MFLENVPIHRLKSPFAKTIGSSFQRAGFCINFAKKSTDLEMWLFQDAHASICPVRENSTPDPKAACGGLCAIVVTA